jgi:hypothetical protein
VKYEVIISSDRRSGQRKEFRREEAESTRDLKVEKDFDISEKLPKDQRDKLSKLLQEFSDVFIEHISEFTVWSLQCRCIFSAGVR